MTNAFTIKRTLSLLFLSSVLNPTVFSAEDPGKTPGTDTLTFVDGEKLIGHLLRSTGNSVMFHSNMAGNVTIEWSKIKELHSNQTFAVVEKGVKLRTDESDAKIPQGSVSLTDGNLQVRTVGQTAPFVLPLSETADVIDQATFDRVVLSRPAWYQNWKGTATVGVAVVNATQSSQSYTSSINFARDIPGESWMDPESRTTLVFTSAYGQLKQPDAPTLKTSIFHAQAERDRYVSPRLFLFIAANFDHDYSQGLDLQQTYSSGIGWSLIKSDLDQLDLRAAVGYEDQRFFLATQNQHLISGVFSEAYNRKFRNKITLHQDFSTTPAWSNLNAVSATGDLNLTIPVIKRMNFTFGVADTYLNNPSPGFRKNSFQFTSGISYVQP
ncbi:MAG: DUF481 domain-containing protein [Bryobacteraceae bacterium]